MKYLTRGIAFASILALPVHAAMSSMGASMGKSPFRLYLSLGGAYKKKDIKVTTDMSAEYNTSFYGVAEGADVFGNDWDAAGVIANNNYSTMALAGLSDATIAPIVSDAARIEIARTFELPDQIHYNPDGLPAGAHAVALVPHALMRLMTSHAVAAGANPDYSLAGVLRDDRYGVSNSQTAHLDTANFAVRLDGGIGFAIMDELVVYVSSGYCFEIGMETDKASMKLNLDLKDDDTETVIKAADGTTKFKKRGLASKPFAWNKHKLTKDIKTSAIVKETVNIFGGLRWMPCHMVELFAYAGVKRYEVAVKYDGGYFAYPGRPELYAEDFRKKDNLHKLLVKNEKTYTFKETVWPFAFGGGINLVFCGMHHLGFAIEYAAFDTDLTGSDAKEGKAGKLDESKDDSAESSTDKYVETGVFANPIGDVENLADMAPNIQSWHMSDAKDVKYKIQSKVEVTDLTFKLAYTVSI